MQSRFFDVCITSSFLICFVVLALWGHSYWKESEFQFPRAGTIEAARLRNGCLQFDDQPQKTLTRVRFEEQCAAANLLANHIAELSEACDKLRREIPSSAKSLTRAEASRLQSINQDLQSTINEIAKRRYFVSVTRSYAFFHNAREIDLEMMVPPILYQNADGSPYFWKSPPAPSAAANVYFSMPLFRVAVLFAALPAGWLAVRWLRKARRRRARMCTTCGYDLRASEIRCPECGAPLPSDTPSWFWPAVRIMASRFAELFRLPPFEPLPFILYLSGTILLLDSVVVLGSPGRLLFSVFAFALGLFALYAARGTSKLFE